VKYGSSIIIQKINIKENITSYKLRRKISILPRRYMVEIKINIIKKHFLR